MNSIYKIETLLRDYRLGKARISILENQIKRLVPEAHEDYIEYRMYERGYSGATPKFIIEQGKEVAELNKVEATALEYKKKCQKEYREAKREMEKELKELIYNTSIVEDCMEILYRINEKYKKIIEGYYINNVRIEDMADSMHISRSRCYELCKEALRCLSRVIFGDRVTV